MKLSQLKKVIIEIANEQRSSERLKKRQSRSKELTDILSEVRQTLLVEEEKKFKDVYGAPKDFDYGDSPVDKLAMDGPSKEDFNQNPLFSGDGSTDKVKAGFKLKFPANKWLPAQKEVRLAKSLSQALGMLTGGDFKPGGNLGGVGVKTSGGGRILDGHHRWGATMLINPSLELICTGVDLSFEEAIPVLRAIGVAFGHEKGNPGGGGSVWESKLEKDAFSELFDKTLASKVKDIEKLRKGAKMYMADLIEGDVDTIDEGEFKDALIDSLYNNYLEWYAIGAKANLDELPPRVNMPVLVGKAEEKDDEKKGTQGNRTGGDEVFQASSLLTRGKVDIKPEYEMFDESTTRESKTLNESKVISRWEKLAGIE